MRRGMPASPRKCCGTNVGLKTTMECQNSSFPTPCVNLLPLHVGSPEVLPDDEREARDGGRRVHQRRVAEEGLPREGGEDLRDGPEGRQDHGGRPGVAKEPEDVQEHRRVAAPRRVEEAGAEVAGGEE